MKVTKRKTSLTLASAVLMGLFGAGYAGAAEYDAVYHGGTIYTIEANFIGDAFILNFIVGNNQVWEDGGDSGIQFE